jgi:hypothetical protein
MADDAGIKLHKDIAVSELRAKQIEQAFLFEVTAKSSDADMGRGPEQAVLTNRTAFVHRNATDADTKELPRLLIAAP